MIAVSERKLVLADCFEWAINLISLALVIAAVTTVIDWKLDMLSDEKNTFSYNVATVADRTKQLDCLAKNIYWEAASEPFEGKVAVAQVTLNRVKSGRFADSVCGVVYEKNVIYQKVICQFSWSCNGSTRIVPIHTQAWNDSNEVAKKVLLENFRLPGLKDALYYHATYISPGWNREKISTIGQHVFYK
jgi:spore germination cell wall hydrolase CwlJ-like protein